MDSDLKLSELIERLGKLSSEIGVVHGRILDCESKLLAAKERLDDLDRRLDAAEKITLMHTPLG